MNGNKIFKTLFIQLFLLFFLPIFVLHANSNERTPFFINYKQIETEHFQIIYEEVDAQSAFEVASFCEEAYTNVTNILGSFPKKIKVLLHGRVDLANGSYYPIPEVINLFITSPIDHFNGAKTESWLKGLFIHELTHYIHISYEKGWIYELSKFFGPSIKTVPGAFLPGWMLEGYTTNLETILTEGGRGRNPIFEMTYKSHILEGNLFTRKQAVYSSNTPPVGRIYVSGYIFVDYLIKKYGESIMKEIHHKMVINPFAPNKAVEEVTGKNVDQLWDEMRLDLMNKYKEDSLIEAGTALSPYLKGDWNQPVVTDQGLLLYRADLKHPSALIFYDPISQKETIIKKVRLNDHASFSSTPNGKIIVYSTLDANLASPGGTSYTSDLFLLEEKYRKSNGKPYWKTTRLTKNQHLWHPAISSDGKRIIAIQKVASYSQLVEVNRKTGEVTTLFSSPQTTLYTPQFSPNSEAITFVYNKQGKQDIWILENEEARPITSFNDGSEYYPRFINNDEIIFTADFSGSLQLFKINKQTLETQLVLQDPVGILSAIPYKEGYLYSSYRSLGQRFFVSTEQQHQSISQKSFINTPIKIEDYPETKFFPALESKFYPNIPHLIGWTPVPFNYTEKTTAESALGIGAFLVAQSIDKESYVQALISFPFTVAQPNIFLDTRFPIGFINASYTLEQQYNSFYESINNFNEKQYMQETYHQFSLSIPLYAHNMNNQTIAAFLNTGLSHLLQIQDTDPFHLFSPTNGILENRIEKHQLVQYTGLTFQFTEGTSPISIYPGLQFFISIGGQFLLPTLKETDATLVGYGDLGLSVPIIDNHNIFTELNLAYSDRLNLAFNISPRGYTPQVNNTRGKGLATLGYNFNFGETDLPLFSQLSFQGFAMAVFAQTQFWFDAQQTQSPIASYIYLGLEFMPIIGWSEGTFPITVGVNARFDTSGQTQFTLENNISPYFSINMSFINNFQNKKASWEGRKSEATWRVE